MQKKRLNTTTERRNNKVSLKVTQENKTKVIHNITQEPDQQTPNHQTKKNGIPATAKCTREHEQRHSDTHTHTHKKLQVHRTKQNLAQQITQKTRRQHKH